MEINEISSLEYSKIFDNTYNRFVSVPFNELNSFKCEKVVYLLFMSGKEKFGLIAGLNKGKLSSPFSAPYGGFSVYSDQDPNLINIDEVIHCIDNYAIEKGINSVKFILPPFFYNENLVSSTFYSLIRNEYRIVFTDINHHFNITDIERYSNNNLDYSVLKNLRRADAVGLTFKQVFETQDKYAAYSIIKENKASKSRPLHLTFEDVVKTGEIIDIDFFLVCLKDLPIAAAIVYNVAYNVAQVVYWGHLLEHSNSRPMNYLAYKVFDFYSKKNIEIVDLGISSENGVPNYGLSDFKKKIGCTTNIKFTLEKKY